MQHFLQIALQTIILGGLAIVFLTRIIKDLKTLFNPKDQEKGSQEG